MKFKLTANVNSAKLLEFGKKKPSISTYYESETSKNEDNHPAMTFQ
jgi:hypothetical protein